ncbi:histidine kinase N-terminal 7TM domain-containing protein [Halosolutus gelatinilyticus]|uniref:histidine kinase N-terminal 7TM domain-containing protein n=1 Tax=Halosolutus gelatinilyticus TaxID=2931975 RepID=UPI001FF4FC11|nr:histidine kinase N-terminal 7TM domain-containing protein [Halosolutus gelatinilyticus]
MSIDPAAVGVVYVGIGTLSLGFLRTAYRYREKPGSTGFALLVIAIGLWSTSVGVGYAIDRVAGSIAIYALRILAAQLVAVGCVLLAVEYTDQRDVSAAVAAVLIGYLLAGQAFVWTNGAHGLVFRVGSGGAGTLFFDVDYGPVFWLHSGLGYALVVLSSGLLIVEFWSSTGARRRQSAILALALPFPLLLNAVSNLDVVPVSYDLTPIGFLASEVLYTWALYGAGFLSVVPIARRTAIDAMDDPYVTLDRERIVVDLNDAAARILDVDDGVVGARAESAFADHPALVSVLADGETAQAELTIDGRDERYHFHVTLTPLSRTSNHRGSVLVMRDISSLKRREEQLRRREAELDLLRQVFTRVLRHNLRNSLCIVNGHGETIAAEADEPFADMGAAIAAEGDHLDALAQKTTTIARLVDDHEIVRYDLVDRVRSIADAIADDHPNATIECSLPDAAPIIASNGLDAALRNLIENAVEHGAPNADSRAREDDSVQRSAGSRPDACETDASRTSDGPTVRIGVRRSGETTTLEIADDGPGIPQHEIDVLREGRETTLEHGSGLGLWLVDWVVAHSGGDLSFESTAAGTTVAVRFEAAASDAID